MRRLQPSPKVFEIFFQDVEKDEDVIARSEATKHSPSFSEGKIASLPELALSVCEGVARNDILFSFSTSSDIIFRILQVFLRTPWPAD
jgi:hypothetical protein